MVAPLLATKIHVPPLRPGIVTRPRLVTRLDEVLERPSGVGLVSASAGFGKTTLISQWVVGTGHPAAWLSLDEGDGDVARFLGYLISALQTLDPDFGAGLLNLLQSPQPPPVEILLTALLNEIAALPGPFILVLDDYHTLDSEPVDDALNFLVGNLPPQMRLVIASREDPPLPLARLRVRGQLTELRAANLRFTPAEAADFLNRMMGLNLPAEDIAALESRTEGWIAGLQLAALSMQGNSDITAFIQSFTGSHRFVLDYLMEEVLRHQPQDIQDFLLRTSILDRMCGPLCDAVLGTLNTSSHLLETLERGNLFIVPLDNERRWYRYHHLFGDFLRQRLLASALTEDENGIAELHIHASQWLEQNDLLPEAFQHAVAANDVSRAERLAESPAMPRHFRSVSNTIIRWLDGLPKAVKDARPSLWVRSAAANLVAGQTAGVAESLQAAETALQAFPAEDPQTRSLTGRIASARATLALTQYQPAEIFAHARRALEYLPPEDLASRFTAFWAMGFASYLQGNRAAALENYQQAVAAARVSGEPFPLILSTSGLGHVQELETRLREAVQTYESVLPLAGEHPIPSFTEIYIGLARVYYEWNDLERAADYGEKSLHLAHQYDKNVDRFLISEAFLARLKLAQGNRQAAANLLTRPAQAAQQPNFAQRMPEVIADLVIVSLGLGQLAAAGEFAKTHPLPLSQARVLLAQGKPASALHVLDALGAEMESRGWQDEKLRALVLQSLALHALDQKDSAAQTLAEALTLAEPDGFIRLFVDEGEPMRLLLLDWKQGAADLRLRTYADGILAAFPGPTTGSLLPEMLTPREVEVLGLIALGLSNTEISQRLYLALNTVKGYNQKIFGKLQAQNRTEAVARARELGLL
ncbi:MAG: LuxR C-terminal-related transcriptional regulator [Anaerolineales bacterium]